ncbi:MAG: hypothetical protein ACRES1_03305 [Steroidobacteraceae bacterium]
MRLAKISEFRRLMYAAGSAPQLATLRARIRQRRIPGGMVQGNQYYVDLDEFDRQTNLRQRVAAEASELARHPVLHGLV